MSFFTPRFLSMTLWTAFASLLMPCVLTRAESESDRPTHRPRRVLYNFDGDSCLSTKAGSKGPVAVHAADVKRLIEEVAYQGSRVDTVLVCINAQVMYYPTKVGTMRGTHSTAEERAKWPAAEKQRFANLKAFFDADVDPYAIMLAETKARGREALLTFRMNDDHGVDFLRTQFLADHPDWRLGTKQYQGSGAMDFGRDEVRNYTFQLIEEAVGRYDCDGIELDFNRFPRFFKDGSTDERVAKMNSLVDPTIIALLYEASQAGVKIELIIRGMCCLKPGIPGVSDNIRVRSIIGRFLEHTRVFHFHNDGKPETWCSSADFMSRNMFHRVETCFPLLDKKLATRVRKDLETYLVDNCQSWLLQSDGSYQLQDPGSGDAISVREEVVGPVRRDDGRARGAARGRGSSDRCGGECQVDPDRDLSSKRDKVDLKIETKFGEKETVSLEETFTHSGVFTGSFRLQPAEKPVQGNLDGNLSIESFFGDLLSATYHDPAANSEEGFVDYAAEATVSIGADGLVSSFSKIFADEELAVRTQFHVAESYFELFKSHLKLGRDKEAAEEADQKSFCDEEIGESKSKQADLTGKLDKTSARIQKAEADKAKLSPQRSRNGELVCVTVSGQRADIALRLQRSLRYRSV